ncbi:MAG: S8 family serine peptidase [Pseudomonadota bacterium]
MRSATRLLPILLLSLSVSCGKTNTQTSADTGGTGTQPKPGPSAAQGFSGTISFTRSEADFQQLAHALPQTNWAEGEMIVMRQKSVTDQDVQKEITQAGGDIVKQKYSFNYDLVRSRNIKNTWRKTFKDAVRELAETGSVSEKTRSALQDVHRRSGDFIKGFRRKRHLFAKAVPNYIRKASTTFNPRQWALGEAKLPDTWEQFGRGSDNVVVAVLDTGVRGDHPNLVNRLNWSDGYDFVNDEIDNDETAGPDDNPDEPSTSNASFHGTHVAGIVAAEPSGTSFPINGIAEKTKILPIRVLGEDGGTDYDIAQGILYAAGLLIVENEKTPQHRADIINLSFGGPNESPILEDAIQQATAAGVVVVVAAGNDTSDERSYPAAYPQVISVGALSPGEAYASYSNYGVNADIMAPGGGPSPQADANGDGYPDGILSSWVRPVPPPGDVPALTYMSGTSMASPFVAGVVALMKSVNPKLGLPDIRKALFDNASLDRLTGCENRCGRGALDLSSLLQTTQSMAPSSAKIQLAQDWVVTTPDNPSAELRLANAGTGSLEILKGEPVRVDNANPTGWLSVTSTQDSQGVVLKFVADKTKMGTDPAAAVVSIVTNAAEIVVTGSNSGRPSYNGVAQITVAYEPEEVVSVALLDASAGDRKAVAWTYTSKSKSWTYHFDPPTQGEYFVFAGKDDDHDGFICSAGDPCGAYPSLASPMKLSVGSPGAPTDLNFGVSRSDLSGLEIRLPKE